MLEKHTGIWARMLGISLRPWSGHAPLSLILRGLIHLAFCAFIITLIIRFGGSDGVTGTDEELALVRGLVTPAVIVLVVLAGIGAARALVGVVDLIPRKSVAGVVVSVQERKVGDFLPVLAQRLIFERNATGIDRRRRRTEVVLATDTGERQWTVRSRRVEREIAVGARVRLTVTPLAGHVAKVEPLPSTPDRVGNWQPTTTEDAP